MKKKGTLVVLLLILVAGIGLYFAYHNKDIVRLPQSTTGTTLAELWETDWRGHAHPPASGNKAASTAKSEKKSQSTNGSTSTAKSTTSGTKKQSGYAYAEEYNLYPSVAEIPVNKYLICVNRNRSLPKGYSAAVKTQVCVSVYKENRKMETEAAKHYKLMYDAAIKDKIELIPYSAFRSTSHQKNNFDNSIKRRVSQGMTRKQAIEKTLETIQLPGCSEHETGLAIDITRKGVWDTDHEFYKTKEYEWLQKHAAEYGFILRYPENKFSITKVKFEPWHWRYVGVEDAKKIKASGKCLEEYMNLA